MTAYRKFWKWNIGFRNRERLFPVLPIVKKKKKINADRPTLDFFDMWQWTHIYFFFALPLLSGVCVDQSLVFCFKWLINHCLSFSFGHCIVCSLINTFWLSLWYLQSFLNILKCHANCYTNICLQITLTQQNLKRG